MLPGRKGIKSIDDSKKVFFIRDVFCSMKCDNNGIIVLNNILWRLTDIFLNYFCYRISHNDNLTWMISFHKKVFTASLRIRKKIGR